MIWRIRIFHLLDWWNFNFEWKARMVLDSGAWCWWALGTDGERTEEVRSSGEQKVPKIVVQCWICSV